MEKNAAGTSCYNILLYFKGTLVGHSKQLDCIVAFYGILIKMKLKEAEMYRGQR